MSEKVAKSLDSDSSSRMVAALKATRIEVFYAIGVLVFALLFSAAGAYDTDKVGFIHRFAMWAVVVGLLIAQTALLFRVLTRLPLRVRFILIPLVMTAAMAVEVELLKYTGLVPHDPDPILPFILFLSPIVIPTVIVVLFAELFQAANAPEPTQTILNEGSIVWANANVAWVHASDHYLEVGLQSGETHFVRGRMKDAVPLLGSQGQQVHRSWWVARSDVDRVETKGRDRVILVKQGKEIPIGRSRVDALKADGWF